MTYIPIKNNKKNIKTLIKWLINNIQNYGGSGNGDGLWYSKYYSIVDIEKFITKEKLLPEHWTMKMENGELYLGENQEWFIITNSGVHFKNISPHLHFAIQY